MQILLKVFKVGNEISADKNTGMDTLNINLIKNNARLRFYYKTPINLVRKKSTEIQLLNVKYITTLNFLGTKILSEK